MNRVGRVAFTLIELLVVMGLLALLVALLLPAGQAARERARQIHCVNNLRQIGVALLNHEATYRAFPPSSTSRLPSSWGPGTNTSNHSWCSQILPYLEEQALHDRIDFAESALAQVNESAASYVVPTYRCPSYRGASLSQHNSYLRPSSQDRSPYAIGNYVAMGATEIQTLFSPGTKLETQGILRPKGHTKAGDVRDGLSHTFLVAESREEDLRVWIDGRVAAFTAMPLAPGVVALNFTKYYPSPPTAKYGPSSEHPGGGHHGFADGSVHFIRNEVSLASYIALTTFAGRETVRDVP